jgi:hypothetical protein
MQYKNINFKILDVLSYLDACSSSDEEYEEDDVITIVLLALVKRRRSTIVYRERLIWDEHVRLLLEEGQFTSMYRMSFPTFKKLLKLLSPFFEFDIAQANQRSKGCVNVQATCDAKCKFTYLSVRSPGGTWDSRAFYGSSLKDFLDEIPRGFYAVGDSAYTLSSSLLVPYTGADKKKKGNDVFIFHLSQLRIKIEQAFGLLVNKWRVFKRPIELKLERVPCLIECCMHLHNWCINGRDIRWIIPDMTPTQVEEHVASYEEYMDDLDHTNANQRGGGRFNVRSMGRDAIKKQLVAEGRDRPRHNRMHNSNST